MKKLLLPLFFAFLVMGCENDSESLPVPDYSYITHMKLMMEIIYQQPILTHLKIMC